MAALRYLLPALAAIGQAAAQCGGEEPTTINSSGDASALASCSTFQGDLVISESAAGQIDLSGIGRITGSLIMENNGALTSLGGSSLQEIGKEFRLLNDTVLSSLNFPRLATVDSIKWVGLAGIQQLSFGTTGVQMAGSVDIENTQLTSLQGINLQVVDSMTIANNPYLNDITMQLGNVTNQLRISDNGQKVNVQLPNLIWANNITIGNASQYSAPSLQAVNKSMGFRGCHFTSLGHANLTSIGGDLTILSNDQLNNISYPQLTGINGGFTIGDNPKLEKIDGFPMLQTIGGGVDFHGNFSSFDLPALKDAKGAVNIQSSDPNLDCSQVDKYAQGRNVIKGKASCKPGVSNPSSDPTKAQGGSRSSSAAQPVIITGATGVLGVIAAIFGML